MINVPQTNKKKKKRKRGKRERLSGRVPEK